LGYRLIEICDVVLKLEGNDAFLIFGDPDYLKFRSSITLFSQVQNANPVFSLLLKKFFNNEPDYFTLNKIIDSC
jgi:uncharacterized protein (DUF1810 family)